MKPGMYPMSRLASLAGVFYLFLAPLAVRGQQNDFDSWRENFGARLDESIAKLQNEEERGRNSPLSVVSWRATGTEAPSGLPFSFAAGVRQNRFPNLASILLANGLPPSLLGVAAVESGFGPGALSPKGARGLWQLMPETARRYGLVVEPSRDDRLDPVMSTHAAARYMNDLYARFQDWPLTLAAYNAGEGRVERALERRGGDFWTLSRLGALPEETRRYVPAVLARIEEKKFTLSDADDPALRVQCSMAGRVMYALISYQER